MDMRAYIEKGIQALRFLDYEKLNLAVNVILGARNRSGIVNGGSEATASNMVCDLARGVGEVLDGERLHVICLSDNTPKMIAIANDFSYEDIFVFQQRG